MIFPLDIIKIIFYKVNQLEKEFSTFYTNYFLRKDTFYLKQSACWFENDEIATDGFLNILHALAIGLLTKHNK